MKKIIISAAIILVTLSFFTSCIKQKFDSPPDTTNIDPKLPVNSTIWQLKQKYNGTPVQITDEITISGIVTADDRSGNFYKQIIIQDSSAAIPILIGRLSLYNDYPIGRKIYVKCKGLWLGNYGKFVQLGGAVDASNALSDIPSAKISSYIVKGNFVPDSIKPIVVNIDMLKSPDNQTKLLGCLIKLDSVQFLGSLVGMPYASSPDIASGTDRTIEDCAESQVVVRNSGYASFRAYTLPAGKGPLVAIYSRYNNNAQLLIRDTSDVQMYGNRCGSANLVTIRSIRDMFPGTGSVTVPNQVKIKGIVISDKSAANISNQNIVIQDNTGGIVVRFSTSTGLPSLGDEVEINISAANISEFPTTGGGVLQVATLSTGKILKTGTGNITPKVATLKQVNDSLEVWESTLVKVNSVTFPAGTYSGSKIITDPTGSITLYTASGATFSGSTLPASQKSVTAIVGQYTTTKQLSIRNLNDIQ